MRGGIEPVREEPRDAVATEFSGRQRDAMDDDQRNGSIIRPRVAIARANLSRDVRATLRIDRETPGTGA